jgi:hypothetical protein
MPFRIPAAALVLLLAVAVLAPAPAHAAGTEQAQRRLNQLGCDAGRGDGHLGPHTRSAIIRFQAANRLGQSGRLDRATRSRLNGARQVRCDRRPVVRSGSGRRVVISQRQNYVWLVRDGGGVVAQGPVIDNPGVLGKGSYRVGSHCGRAAKIRMNSSSIGSWWLPHFTRFAPCGVGFHRIPLSKSTGNQMHADWLLGTNMQRSAGCVRLSRGMAARIWDFATVGTRVVVR